MHVILFLSLCIHLGPCHTEHPAAKKGVYQPSVFGADMYYWLVVSTYPSEKYEFVNWDDDIPIYYGKIKHVPNHQSVYIYIYYTHQIAIQNTSKSV